MLNVLSGFADEGVNGVNIVLEAACYHRVVLVVLDVIGGRIVNARDTALSEHGVAQRQLALAEDKDIEVGGEIDSGVQSRNSAACDNNVIVYRHSEHVLCLNFAKMGIHIYYITVLLRCHYLFIKNTDFSER